MGEIELEKGDRVYIKMVGHAPVTAFANLDRQGQQPHFKADGVAVWLRKGKS